MKWNGMEWNGMEWNGTRIHNPNKILSYRTIRVISRDVRIYPVLYEKSL